MTAEGPQIEPIERVLEQLTADAAFAKPVRQGDVLVIPVAEVEVDLGYGHQVGTGMGPIVIQIQRTSVGGGSGVSAMPGARPPEEDAGAAPPPSEAALSNGGAVRGQVTPRGYIQVTSEGVRFEPLIEITRLGLAGIAFSAWSVFWITSAIRAAARASGRRGR